MNNDKLKQAYGFIKADIERELKLASLAEDKAFIEIANQNDLALGGGNFLCALSLFSYIEFLGKEKYSCKKANGDDFASENFNKLFDDLGEYYKELRKHHNIYKMFRCGLVHEYYVKGTCTIAMFGDENLYGIGFDDNQYYVIVKNLLKDFLEQFDEIIKLNK